SEMAPIVDAKADDVGGLSLVEPCIFRLFLEHARCSLAHSRLDLDAVLPPRHEPQARTMAGRADIDDRGAQPVERGLAARFLLALLSRLARVDRVRLAEGTVRAPEVIESEVQPREGEPSDAENEKRGKSGLRRPAIGTNRHCRVSELACDRQ